MAILFSKVTMRDDYNESEFFVSGFPQEPDDLEGWTAYHEFLDEITEDSKSCHRGYYHYTVEKHHCQARILDKNIVILQIPAKLLLFRRNCAILLP